MERDYKEMGRDKKRKEANRKQQEIIRRNIERNRLAVAKNYEGVEQDQKEVQEALTPNLQEKISLLIKSNQPITKPLVPEEKAIIVELFHEGLSRQKIAKIINRETSTVVRFLQRYSSTTIASRMYFEANADRLARRVVRHANVDQSLEVMDRLDVLPSKDRRGADTGVARVNIMVGVPGQGVPIPTQRDVIDAKAVTDGQRTES